MPSGPSHEARRPRPDRFDGPAALVSPGAAVGWRLSFRPSAGGLGVWFAPQLAWDWIPPTPAHPRGACSPDFVTQRPLAAATCNEMRAIAPISLHVAHPRRSSCNEIGVLSPRASAGGWCLYGVPRGRDPNPAGHGWPAEWAWTGATPPKRAASPQRTATGSANQTPQPVWTGPRGPTDAARSAAHNYP